MNKLALASFWVVTSLLGIIFAVGMALVLRLHLPVGPTMAIAGGFAFLVVFTQYLIGPFLIDWIVKMVWCDPRSVNDEFAVWFRSTCKTFGIREPRFGIIEDGAPNAFTYGHFANDARVVITRGVIDMLSPEELKSVVAHELGHIKHRDFILMTVVQGLVLVLYALYISARWSNNRNTLWVVVVSYIAYQLSYYISLYLSRVREYMADYASAHIMGTGNPLSIALVKIAYGLAQSKPVTQADPVPSYAQPAYRQGSPLAQGSPVAFSSQPRGNQNIDAIDAGLAAAVSSRRGLFGLGGSRAKQNQENPSWKLEARTFGAFGVMGASAIRTAIAWTGTNGQPDPMNFTRAARWELYNPWSRIAEWISTHPMTVRRIQALQKLNRMWGVKNAFDFSKIEPGRYTGFMRDLWIMVMPTVFAVVAFVAVLPISNGWNGLPLCVPAAVGAYLFGHLLQVLFMYPGSPKPKKVIECLNEIDVSHVKAIPVVMQGTITGRVTPGVFWASDFILQDADGFVTCVVRMPFGLEWLYGWFRAGSFVGHPVTVYGWYRRFTAPYVQVDRFVSMMGGRTDTYLKAFLIGLDVIFMVLVALAVAWLR